jgi:putative transposase
MTISLNPFRSTRKSVETTVVSPVQDIDDGSLVDEGWRVSVKRVYRIWRREGLRVPQKQPKRGRLWLNDGSCVRLRPERPNHVWSYDFMQDSTGDGRRFRMLTVIDEFTRRCLAIVVARKLNSDDVLEALITLRFQRIRPEGTVKANKYRQFSASNLAERGGDS